jgi:hypothetical protein
VHLAIRIPQGRRDKSQAEKREYLALSRQVDLFTRVELNDACSEFVAPVPSVLVDTTSCKYRAAGKTCSLMVIQQQRSVLRVG